MYNLKKKENQSILILNNILGYTIFQNIYYVIFCLQKCSFVYLWIIGMFLASDVMKPSIWYNKIIIDGMIIL